MGDYDKALNYLEKVVKLSMVTDSEDTPTYLVNLGVARLQRVRL